MIKIYLEVETCECSLLSEAAVSEWTNGFLWQKVDENSTCKKTIFYFYAGRYITNLSQLTKNLVLFTQKIVTKPSGKKPIPDPEIGVKKATNPGSDPLYTLPAIRNTEQIAGRMEPYTSYKSSFEDADPCFLMNLDLSSDTSYLWRKTGKIYSRKD